MRRRRGVKSCSSLWRASIATSVSVLRRYSLRVGKSTLFMGAVPPVPMIQTPRRRVQDSPLRLSARRLREHYTNAEGEQTGFYDDLRGQVGSGRTPCAVPNRPRSTWRVLLPSRGGVGATSRVWFIERSRMRVLRRGALALGLLIASVSCRNRLPRAVRFASLCGASPWCDAAQPVAPIADRDGNIYVLYGNHKDLLETQLFVGHAEGGWSGDVGSQGNALLHGCIGRSETALTIGPAMRWFARMVQRGCKQLLRTDPASSAKLNFAP